MCLSLEVVSLDSRAAVGRQAALWAGMAKLSPDIDILMNKMDVVRGK
jgi:hypothetical protein